MKPQPQRPYMPDYGVKTSPKGMLDWQEIQPRLAASHNYWISTTRPDGRPHAAPVWGLWHKGAFYFNTGDQSQKGRNLNHQPYGVMHLESGDEVVIVEGMVAQVSGEGLLAQLNRAYNQKYGLDIVEDPVSGYVYRLHPARAFAWSEKSFPDTATKWVFSDSS